MTASSPSTRTRPSRGRPREFDIDAALDAAMHVFWRKGYLGTSLSDLTEALGINRPSLYAAFGNKETLFRKVLERYREGPGSCFRNTLEAPTARAAVERLLLGAIESAGDGARPSGCLLVRTLASIDECEDGLRAEVAASRKQNIRALQERFQRAVKEGELPPDARPSALAAYIVSLVTGLAVQASAGASRQSLHAVVEMALAAWPPGHGRG